MGDEVDDRKLAPQSKAATLSLPNDRKEAQRDLRTAEFYWPSRAGQGMTGKGY